MHRDQFLQIIPSETNEGSLTIEFKGIAQDGEWSRPVNGLGFYITGREQEKRDVFIDVYDTNNDLIASTLSLTPPVSGQSAIQFFGIKINEGENLISKIELR